MQSRAAAIVVYTALRIAVFLVVWLVIELLTPVTGVWAIVVAILVSGAISLVILDRQRNRVGLVAAGFFGGLNERIEASARAEDIDDEPSGQGTGQGEEPAEDKPVGEQE